VDACPTGIQLAAFKGAASLQGRESMEVTKRENSGGWIIPSLPTVPVSVTVFSS